MTVDKKESSPYTTQKTKDSHLANRLLSQSKSQNQAAIAANIAPCTLQKVLIGKEPFNGNVREKVEHVLSRYKVEQLTEHLHHPCIKMAHRRYWTLQNSKHASIADYEEIIDVTRLVRTHPESRALDKMHSNFLASVSYFSVFEAHKKVEKNSEDELKQEKAKTKAKEAVETAASLSQAAEEVANQASYKVPDIVKTILTWNCHITKLAFQMEGTINATDLRTAISTLTPLAPDLGATAYLDMIELLLLEESLTKKKSEHSNTEPKDNSLWIQNYLKSIRSLLNENDRYLTNYIAGCKEIRSILADPRFTHFFVTDKKEATS